MKVLARHGEKIVIVKRVLKSITVSGAPDFPSPIKTKRGLFALAARVPLLGHPPGASTFSEGSFKSELMVEERRSWQYCGLAFISGREGRSVQRDPRPQEKPLG